MSVPESSDAAGRLHEKKADILARWEASVRRELSPAREASRPVLLDSIPLFLDELTAALGRDDPHYISRSPLLHAQQRAEQTNYSLEQVLREYALLQDHIVDALEEGEGIPVRTVRTIHQAIHVGVAKAAALFVDIQEQALRGSEERFRLLVEHIQDVAIFMLSPSGVVTSWNAGAERIKGYAASEIVGSSFERFYGADDVAQGRPARGLAAAERAGRFEDTGWRIRKDGSRFMAQVTITAVRNVDGSLLGFSKLTRDISEQSAFNERFRSVVNTVNDGIITIDERATVQTINPAAICLFGYDEKEVVGQNIKMLMPEPYRVEHDQYMENYLTTGVRRVIGIGRQVVGQRKDRTTFPLELAVSEFSTNEGRFFTGVVRDVTERTALEAQLVKRASELQEQNERKDEFLAVLGHELRNPLAAVQSAAEVIRRVAPPASPVLRMQEIVARQVKYLVRMVDDLLDVGRLSRGRLSLQLERCDVRELVQHAVETTRQSFAERQQTLDTELPARPVAVVADAARITQSVANLLHNASKFSGPGSRVTVAVQAQDGQALIAVTDPGAGIDPELLPELFDLFARGTRWVNNVQSGLGIGLKLVKTLVEMHGGSVVAESQGHGKGSRMSILLPLAGDAGTGGQIAGAGARRPQREQPRGPLEGHGVEVSPLKVLIVDDNIDAVSGLVQIVTMWGHQPRAAHSGEEAIRLARAEKPDVVVLDIGMPEMDGYEVVARMKADPSLTGVRFIALTGYGQESDVCRAVDAGFDHHCTKPADFSVLHGLLKKK